MKTPTYDQWIAERVSPLEQRELEELLGSALLRTVAAPKALALLGDSACGRSTLIDLLTAAVGRDAVLLGGEPTPPTPKLSQEGVIGAHEFSVALFRLGEGVPPKRGGVHSRPLVIIEAATSFATTPDAGECVARITLATITRPDPSVPSRLRAELPGITARWVAACASSLA